MIDEKLQLTYPSLGGFTVYSTSSSRPGRDMGLHLISINPDGTITPQRGVVQGNTNFQCVDGEDIVFIE